MMAPRVMGSEARRSAVERSRRDWCGGVVGGEGVVVGFVGSGGGDGGVVVVVGGGVVVIGGGGGVVLLV